MLVLSIMSLEKVAIFVLASRKKNPGNRRRVALEDSKLSIGGFL